MNSNVKIILTDQAVKQLEKYKEGQGNKLIEEIASRKFVPGDDEVEITASDIEKGRASLNRPKLPITILIVLYIVLGIFMMFLGFNYDYIKSIILKNEPLQVVLLIMGLMFFMIGLICAVLFILRDYKYFLAGKLFKNRMTIE